MVGLDSDRWTPSPDHNATTAAGVDNHQWTPSLDHNATTAAGVESDQWTQSLDFEFESDVSSILPTEPEPGSDLEERSEMSVVSPSDSGSDLDSEVLSEPSRRTSSELEIPRFYLQARSDTTSVQDPDEEDDLEEGSIGPSHKDRQDRGDPDFDPGRADSDVQSARDEREDLDVGAGGEDSDFDDDSHARWVAPIAGGSIVKLRAELSALRADLVKLNNKETTRDAELGRLKTELSTSRSAMTSLQDSVLAMEKSQAQMAQYYNKEFKELREIVKRHAVNGRTLQERITHSEERLEDLVQQIAEEAAALQKLDSLQENVDVLLRVQTDLQTKLVSASRRLDEAQAEMLKLPDLGPHLQALQDQMSSMIKRQQDEFDSKLTQGLENVRTELLQELPQQEYVDALRSAVEEGFRVLGLRVVVVALDESEASTRAPTGSERSNEVPSSGVTSLRSNQSDEENPTGERRGEDRSEGGGTPPELQDMNSLPQRQQLPGASPTNEEVVTDIRRYFEEEAPDLDPNAPSESSESSDSSKAT